MLLMPRRITLQLNRESVQNAIKEVNDFKNDLRNAINTLAQDLYKEGVQIVKARIVELDTPHSTGHLENSVQGVFDPTTGVGVISVYAENSDYNFNYACIVEFGSGVWGKRHPAPDQPSWWGYDEHEHGEAGWWYTGGHWTQGMPSRPFMYQSYLELLEKARGIAKVSYHVTESRYSSKPKDYDPIDVFGYID